MIEIIYFPKSLLKASAGIMFCLSSESKNYVTIAAILPEEHLHDQNVVLKKSKDLKVCGKWCLDDSSYYPRSTRSKVKLDNQMFTLSNDINGIIKMSGKSEKNFPKIVIVDIDMFLNSGLFSSNIPCEYDKNEAIIPFYETNPCSELVESWEKICDINSESKNICLAVRHQKMKKVQNHILKVVGLFLKFLFSPVLICSSLAKSHPTSVIGKQLFYTATVCQLHERYQKMKLLYTTDVENKITKQRKCNIYLRIIMDVCLGVLLMLYLTREGVVDEISYVTLKSGDKFVNEIIKLLEWIMGAPAGLKLNKQLDQFLGKFFSYHIYLWTVYLAYIEPWLSSILWYSSCMGLFGLTIQISLVYDLISMMTLHIYCFYVYAARLYSLQVYALCSLWRLFRGKKWNVFRQRVDSVQYDVDRLFMGTLFFTILLFLLPTILVYYIAFLLLRVGVLLIQGSLHKILYIMNAAPIYSILNWVLRTNKVTGDVKFSHVFSHQNGSLVVEMKVQRLSFTKLIEQFWTKPCCIEDRYTWKEFFSKLVRGHLVYPWLTGTRHEFGA